MPIFRTKPFKIIHGTERFFTVTFSTYIKYQYLFRCFKILQHENWYKYDQNLPNIQINFAGSSQSVSVTIFPSDSCHYAQTDLAYYNRTVGNTILFTCRLRNNFTCD